MNRACTCVCFKFPGACFCQKLAESDEIWRRYHKNKKGDVFFWDTVYVYISRNTYTLDLCIWPIKFCQNILTGQAQTLHVYGAYNTMPSSAEPSVEFPRSPLSFNVYSWNIHLLQHQALLTKYTCNCPKNQDIKLQTKKDNSQCPEQWTGDQNETRANPGVRCFPLESCTGCTANTKQMTTPYDKCWQV